MMQKKRPDINKILRSILLILGIVLMLLKISARASAADMPDYVKEYLDDYLVDNNFPSSFQTYYNNAVSDGCAYFLPNNHQDIPLHNQAYQQPKHEPKF